MKSLLLGIVLFVIVGIGGLIFRNAIEHPNQPIACPLDALLCPDGTAVGRTGTACTFPACPPPNVTLAEAKISFALPEGFVPGEEVDAATIAAYEKPKTASSSVSDASIIIRRFAVGASSTPLSVIEATAIGGTSGMPVPKTAFTSVSLGTHRFTVVAIDRFEAVIDTAYYLARGSDVLRFDAIDRNVLNWTDPNLNVSMLPAAVALRAMLSKLQGE